MMTPDYIINVSESDFEYEVISYSQNIPVIVDFWAEWCKPCKILSPMLERLVIEGNGAFRLARLDVDANPNLALRFSVRSLPTVKVFSEGQITAEFVGLQTEARLREILSKITPPSPASLAAEKADSLLSQHQWSDAEKIYREILSQNPDHPNSLLGLVKALLAQGQASEALDIIYHFPASRQFNQVEVLKPLAEDLDAFYHGELLDEADLDAAFNNSIRLASRGNLPAALDGLLDIIRQDRHYRNDRPRQDVLSILDLMGDDDPLTRQYRNELAAILF